jgi:hypothetical protein
VWRGDSSLPRLDSSSRSVRARPSVCTSIRHESGLHRILLNVGANAPEFLFIANPSVITFGLPKWLSGAPQELVGSPRCRTFQGIDEPGRIDLRSQQSMYVVRHHDPCVQSIVSQLLTLLQTIPYDLGNLVPPQKHWPLASHIQIAVHPNESLSTGFLAGRWIQTMRQGAM